MGKSALELRLDLSGGTLTFDYDVIVDTNRPSDQMLVVQRLLAARAESGNSATFRIEKAEDVVHVIPNTVKDASGKLASNKSLLDTVITLPSKERTGLQTLEDLCEAISKANQLHVVVGTIPSGMFLRHKDQHGIASLKARDALIQLLKRTSNGAKLSWQLLYDPGLKMYALNLHVVS